MYVVFLEKKFKFLVIHLHLISTTKGNKQYYLPPLLSRVSSIVSPFLDTMVNSRFPERFCSKKIVPPSTSNSIKQSKALDIFTTCAIRCFGQTKVENAYLPPRPTDL